MEPFDNDEYEHVFHTDPVPPQSVEDDQGSSFHEEPPRQADSTYRSAGTGRKESPYANSPYESYTSQRQEYYYQPETEPPVKKKKKKKQKKVRNTGRPIWKSILITILILALVGGSCGVTAFLMNARFEEAMKSTADTYTKEIKELQEQINTLSDTAATPASGTLPEGSAMTPAQLYAAQVDSVVAISTTIQTNGYFGPSEGSSAGSGFILSEDGYVITNYHVVEDASAVQVITHDGTEYSAEVKGHDANNDLAVLKVEATGLSAATLGSSTDLAIGDMVVAIGNPLGELSSTQTVGYVSGINREVATGGVTTISMIQTDAAINPGNSGGPLFNMRGEVIGITTAKYSGTTGSGASIEGIGFAIPIDDVEPLIDDLIDYGYVTGAYLGVSVGDTDAESAAMFGLPTGAYVYSVEEGGAAERAGIQAKDIIIALGEYEVSNVTDLTRALRNFKAGDTTTVKLIRSGHEMTLDITLDEKPQDSTPVATKPQESEPPAPEGETYDEWYEYFRRYFGE